MMQANTILKEPTEDRKSTSTTLRRARRRPAGSELRAYLLDSIRRGVLQPGDMTPGQADLARQFDIGEVTVRRTLADLQEEGIVRREQGRGTLITQNAYRLINPQIKSGSVLLALRTYGHVFAELLQKLSRGMSEKRRVPSLLSLDQADGHFHSVEHLSSLFADALQADYEAAIFEWSDCEDPAVWETLSEAAKALNRRGVPVLWLLASSEELPGNFDGDLISVDYRAGTAQATQYLIDGGHKRIAFLAPYHNKTLAAPHAHVAPFLAGYRQAMQLSGLDHTIQIIDIPQFKENHLGNAEQVLSRSDRPSAIVACQDYPLTFFVKGARKLGIKIPEDLALIGFYNTPWAATYELPSVDPCLGLLADQVTRWLGDVRERGKGHLTTLIRPELLVQKSSVELGHHVEGVQRVSDGGI